jgi:hypothetical protein
MLIGRGLLFATVANLGVLMFVKVILVGVKIE